MKFGIRDEEFIRGKVPMTKAEIRAMVMVQADIQPGDKVADIGAGTGSISIEAALAASKGEVYSIERNPEGIRLIEENAEEFGLKNIHTIKGVAPAAMEGLPQAKLQQRLFDKFSIQNRDWRRCCLYETAAAIQKKVTAQQELELANIEKQTAKVQAEKDREVAQINAEKAVIEAEAKAETLRIAAEAEADANRKIAASLTNELIEKIKYEQWNGELPTVTGSTPIISLEP